MTLEELKEKEVYVDGNHGYYFSEGDKVVKKAKRLIKTGYKIFDYSRKEIKEVGISDVEERKSMCRCSGPCAFRGYEEIYEYVDRKNKIYYVRYGRLEFADMWC